MLPLHNFSKVLYSTHSCPMIDKPREVLNRTRPRKRLMLNSKKTESFGFQYSQISSRNPHYLSNAAVHYFVYNSSVARTLIKTNSSHNIHRIYFAILLATPTVSKFSLPFRFSTYNSPVHFSHLPRVLRTPYNHKT